MALDNAPQLGGSFLNLKALIEAGPQLVAFRILEYLPPEPMQGVGFSGTNVPVIADACILSGPRTGELWPAQRFHGGITSALRGVRNPRADKGIPVMAPVFAPGKELLVKVKAHNTGAVGDPASDAEMAHGKAMYEKLGATQLWTRKDLIAVQEAEVPEGPTPAMAGAPVGNGFGGSAGSAVDLGAPAPEWQAGRPEWG